MAIRSQLPAAIQAMMQDGLLERAFQEALRPQLLFPLAGSLFPVQGRVGDTITQTRQGLLTPQTASLGGTDPTPEKWSLEQWSVTLADYGHAITTDLVAGAMSIESEFLRDAIAIAQNAGQSLNTIARNKLYSAYAGGNSWCTTGNTGTTQTVQDASGFTHVMVNGVPTPVSVTNPLPVQVEESGVASAFNVTGVAGNVLTLDASATCVTGDHIFADNRPFQVYGDAAAVGEYDLAAGDAATLALFRSAVVHLRQQNVPTINGYYVAHVNSYVENQLWDDTDFQNVLNTNINARQFTDLAIGVAAGIIFVRNEETPTIANSTDTVQRSIVMGAGALRNAPFVGYRQALETGPQAGAEIQFIDVGVGLPVAYIINLPADIMQRYLNQAWGWIGDFGVPSDSVTGDASLYKRAVTVHTV